MLWEKERFGYQSIHYLVQVSEARVALAEYARYRAMIAEIQVRTILQHAWAEIEHDIQYKSSVAMPSVIRRRFMSLAGLLEIAD
jgi:ppGpp synthetase/RelA/SpoT-type nucleotidyltranferase